MKKLFAFSLVLVSVVTAAAQSAQRICGTGELPQQFETWVQSLSPTKPGKTGHQNVTQSIYYIPVVVHVIHNNEPINSLVATSGNNLNAAQIQSQINILNADFNGTNADTAIIPPVFRPLLGKFQMYFCLAVVNPTGGVMPEPGIDRINRSSKGWNAPPYSMNYADATIKPNSIWDPNRYLNIWVSPLSGSILGYATFPNPTGSGVLGLGSPYGSATSDGVFISNTCFGNTGTSSGGSFNRGRTTTHEIGHWMGLRHIWGDSNCGTDYCNDTPPAQTSNYGCKNFPYRLGTCAGNTTGEMTMNYMDYSDDVCLAMFTADQKYRAQLIMFNSPFRSSLITSTVCNLPTATDDVGISSVAQPTYSQSVNCTNNVINPVVKFSNYAANTVTSALFSFNVNGVNTQTLMWTGNLLPNSTTTVALSQISGFPVGLNTFSVNVSAPNGNTDSNLWNNNSLQQFNVVGTLTLSVNAATVCSGIQASLTASGAPSYTWSDGSVGNSISVSPAASSVYTVSGGSGSCISSKTTAVTVYTTVLNVITSGATITTCGTCNDGSVAATVSKGKGPYTYAWAPTGASTTSLTDLPVGCYTLTVTDFYGCTGSSQFCVTFDTGISSRESATGEFINTVPNPNSGLFTIEFSGASNRHVEIFDMLGRTVKRFKTNTNSALVDISEFPVGVYYLKVLTQKSQAVTKIVKN